MKKLSQSLAFRNILNRPARSIAMLALTALLTVSVFCGTLIVMSLNRGLSSLQNRMGADIMVVPYEATTKSDVSLENVVLLGNTGYFYMDSSIVNKIAEREGIGEISTQYFLSTLSSGCCSVPVQVIGFDPETDFTVTPWIRQSYGRDLKDGEVCVGHRLNAFVGDTLTFYGKDVTVAAKLEETGTDLDTAVYTNANTIRQLIKASVDLNLNTEKIADPDRVVSCVLLNAADGYSVDEVLNDINIHIRKAKAFRTRGLIEGISASLAGVSRIAFLLTAVVWVFCLIVLVIMFTMNVNERKREFAVLRAIGASGKGVSRIVTQESVLLSVAGAVAGVVCGLLVLLPFSGLLEQALDLPFLLPGALTVVSVAALSCLSAILCGALASARAARKVSRTDAALLLREA
ncbi:MAG: FtsX-like permease family protein [Lachnospiraceae bacterium]|nr:FtsX-like permease family protein [Lachnospiraceae bacterium]